MSSAREFIHRNSINFKVYRQQTMQLILRNILVAI